MCVFVSAIGHGVPPMLIFPHKKCPEILLKGAPPNAIAQGSEAASGCMCNELFLVWMSHFISQARPNKANPVLLILDNDISRYSSKLLELAKENGVVMMTVPPHTTHRLQPLDRSVM
ncbi:uncharacterized protein LOC136033720 [Artemia franciscana]|uniref:uncharacterized protein LOC136033720 n=1 Tax=Artemia franciscana TaxID=6661 RepID=UPI0032D9CFD0